MSRIPDNLQWIKSFFDSRILLAIGICVAILISFSIALNATGYWGPSENATLVEAAICVSTDEYNPIELLPLSQQTIYFCVVVEGTTKKWLNLDLYFSGNHVAQDSSIYLKPGTFFHPIILPKDLGPGRYALDVTAHKQRLAYINFRRY